MSEIKTPGEPETQEGPHYRVLMVNIREKSALFPAGGGEKVCEMLPHLPPLTTTKAYLGQFHYHN